MPRALEWAPIGARGSFAPWVHGLKGRSGVYLIRSDAGELLYVGESHTGRLYETITRHFQSWSGPTAGFTYDRGRTEVSIVLCPPAEAVDLQFEMIAEYQPRDNEVGKGLPALEDVPF